MFRLMEHTNISTKAVLNNTVGWKEVVDLPELNLYAVPAKTDTGAKTSVLHCSSIELIRIKRKQYVRFIPLDERFEDGGQVLTLPFHKERKIKNSFGNEENRYIINTKIQLFNQEYDIEISLRDRSEMEYPMLLGRSFLKKRFLVDVSKSNLSEKYVTSLKLRHASKNRAKQKR